LWLRIHSFERKGVFAMKKLTLRIAAVLAVLAVMAQALPADAGNRPIPPRINRGGPAR
jgi:hypothetical protein